MRNRIALAALTLFLLAAPAHADVIVLNASYNENQPFSTHLETFTIPAGHTVVGATVSGTVFGIPESTVFAGTTLTYVIDGYTVPTITIATTTQGEFSGSFSFTFPTSELFRFADGMVIIGSCPLGMQSCNPGPNIESITATLTLITAPAPEPVPEPATLLLLSTGLAGVAAGVRRRRSRAKG
ncbi:MAG TPA: PEP-CTERM sorting domain-containing protein [Pyrinomonadaceae bacterium]|jgi:hypothetical protein|nr:PEP-CTERM sorting domain-containing protein [Pyrinomonadaceae bacterium]